MNKAQEAGIAYAVYQKVKSLPASDQTEVLRFVDYMLCRSSQEDTAWMELSIREALRGLGDDVWPDYEGMRSQGASELPSSLAPLPLCARESRYNEDNRR